MDERALRGVSWTIVSYALNKVVTLLTTVVLARLLTPADFGVVALSYVAIVTLTIFRDAGVGSALIVRDPLTERDKQATFAIILGLAGLSAAILALLSAPIADALGEPQAGDVLAALTLMLVFGSPAWFYEAVMQRELEFRKRFVAITVQTAIYAPVAITLAALGAGVWSLVVGYVAGSAGSALAFTLLAPYRVRPGLDVAHAVTMLRAGFGFMVQGGLAFLRQNVDYLAVGKVIGTAPLGAYSLAYRIAEVPYLAIVDPVARVTFPAFAGMRARSEEVVASFLSVLRLIALVTVPLGVLLSAAADPFVNAILGEKWLAMIGPLAVLGLWAIVRGLAATVGWLLNSVGLATRLAAVSSAILVPLVPGVFVAAAVGGTTAVAWVVVADTLLELIAITVVVQRSLAIPVAVQWRAVRPAVLAAGPAWIVTRGVAHATESLAPAVALVAAVLAGAAVYLAATSAVDRGAIPTAVRQIRRIAGRAPSA